MSPSYVRCASGVALATKRGKRKISLRVEGDVERDSFGLIDWMEVMLIRQPQLYSYSKPCLPQKSGNRINHFALHHLFLSFNLKPLHGFHR